MIRERPGAAKLILLIILAAVLSLGAGPVYSSGHKSNGNGSESSQGQISADRAASIASSATGGRVLKVERKGNTYRVRVLLDGERIRNVSVDARTGRLLN